MTEPPRLADHRRRRHADRPHRADRGRHPERLSAGPAQCPADGHGADRQRPPRKLRPCADAAHDQHLHARRQRRSGRADRAACKNGIYAKSFGGGQVDITSGKFVFSCTEAYRIEDGRIGAPIKGATLIGDGPTVLTRVKGIGNDFALDEGVGICGKGGQTVPAGVGQPTLLIDGLTVGGTADLSRLARRRPQILVRARPQEWWQRRAGARPGNSPALPQAMVGEARAAGRGVPRSSANGARRRDPVRPVSAQHVPRPRRPVRDRSSGARRSPSARSTASSTMSRAPTSAASSTCRSNIVRDRADQRRSLLLFTALGDDYLLGYAKKHHDVIERFGRFPHRNAILGRAPRADEVDAGDMVLVTGQSRPGASEQMGDRAEVDPGLRRRSARFRRAARRPRLRATRPRQRRAGARAAESEQLAVAALADRVAHRLDIGRARCRAGDRDVAIGDPGCSAALRSRRPPAGRDLRRRGDC